MKTERRWRADMLDLVETGRSEVIANYCKTIKIMKTVMRKNIFVNWNK